MKNKKRIETFVRATADYTLRECYKRLGDMKLAEEAFIEIYVAWNKNSLSNIEFFKKSILKYELRRVCEMMRLSMDGEFSEEL